VPSSRLFSTSTSDDDVQERFAEHQKNAARLDYPVDVRSLVQYNHGFAVISTNSKVHPGFPSGGVVAFVPDSQGRPIFSLSTLSSHTQNLIQDPRASVTIAAKEFKGESDGRVNIMGKITPVPDDDASACRDLYLKKHPQAYWVDFGDFAWYRMDEIVDIRYVGGFARNAFVKPEEYMGAVPDPIMAFGSHVAQHMNEDHVDATKAMIASAIPGMEVDDAVITSLDSLGMYIKVKQGDEQFKMRLPFVRKAEDRKDVKNIIVEMTQASATAKDEENT